MHSSSGLLHVRDGGYAQALSRRVPHAVQLTEQLSSKAVAAANFARSEHAAAGSPGVFSMSALKLTWKLCDAASCRMTAL